MHRLNDAKVLLTNLIPLFAAKQIRLPQVREANLGLFASTKMI